MNIRNTIIEHYRKFFDLHAKGIALDEDDHLNIEWAEDLVKNCFIPDVVGQSEQLADDKSYQPCDGCNTSCKEWEIFFCKKLG